MSDHLKAHTSRPHWRTRLIQPDVEVPQNFVSLAPAVHRGSTVVFKRLADARDDWRGETYTYGLYGMPTARELGLRISDLEGARHTFVVPGGQAAIALVYLSFCKTGSHALVPESAYRPNRELADNLLASLGIEVEPYNPLIGGQIGDLIRTNTALVWCDKCILQNAMSSFARSALLQQLHGLPNSAAFDYAISGATAYSGANGLGETAQVWSAMLKVR